jgi:Uma2 family endonuclease
MYFYDSRQCLPSSEELPDSDDTPVDNELQDMMPGLLKLILAQIWANRMDWFFGVDMGIYYDPDVPAIVPDGFLSLGVERIVDEELRLSYVLWEENNIPPIFVLEVVSKKYRGEYSRKKHLYADLGVLYYAVYSSHRKKKTPLEIYKLVDGEYQLLNGYPLWMPELQLGLGRGRGSYLGITREWLYWYDEQGVRYLSPEETAEQERQRAEQERQRAEQERQRAEQEHQRAEQERQRAEQERQLREELLEKLRSHGIDPDKL